MSSMTTTDKLLAPLKFDKEGLGAIANDETSTGLAYVLVIVNALIGSIGAFTSEGTTTFGGFGGTDLTPLGEFILNLIMTILLFLLFSWVLAFVLRGFGGTSTTMQSFRMLSFSLLWGIIGSIVDLVAPSLNLGFIFSLLGFIAFIIGLTSYSGVKAFGAFIAVIVALIITMILLVIIIFILVLAVFGALFAAS